MTRPTTASETHVSFTDLALPSVYGATLRPEIKCLRLLAGRRWPGIGQRGTGTMFGSNVMLPEIAFCPMSRQSPGRVQRKSANKAQAAAGASHGF